jgi:hypothetical protein
VFDRCKAYSIHGDTVAELHVAHVECTGIDAQTRITTLPFDKRNTANCLNDPGKHDFS